MYRIIMVTEIKCMNVNLECVSASLAIYSQKCVRTYVSNLAYYILNFVVARHTQIRIHKSGAYPSVDISGCVRIDFYFDWNYRPRINIENSKD